MVKKFNRVIEKEVIEISEEQKNRFLEICYN